MMMRDGLELRVCARELTWRSVGELSVVWGVSTETWGRARVQRHCRQCCAAMCVGRIVLFGRGVESTGACAGGEDGYSYI